MKNNDNNKSKHTEEIVKSQQECTESETGRKLAEVEELYKIMAESSLGAVFIVQDGKIQFINTSAIAYAGYTSEEIIGQSSDILVHPDDREKVKLLAREMLEGRRKSAFDFRLVTKSKHICWISQTVTPIQYNGKPAILGNAIDITDLKQAEELYKIMAESSLGAVFIVQDGKIQFINTSAIAYAGYTSEEIIGQSSDILVHPDDREKVKLLAREMLEGRRKSAFDFRLVTKSKHICWISQTVTPIQYNGKPAILGNAIDVTDLKQAEELYKTLAESSFAAVFIAQDGKFRFINTSAVAYAGYTAEELIGQDANIIIHPDDKERVKMAAREMLAGTRNAAFEFRMVTKQNRIRWISQIITPIQYNGKPAVLGNAIDVTELKQAEELYKTLAESSFAAVFIAQDGKFRFINTSAIAYAGYTAEELIGQSANIIIHPDDKERVKKLSKEMLSGARNAAFEFRMVTKQNQIRWISETVTPIQYGGKPAVLGNAIDVTELKQAEEALRESERLHNIILGSPIPAFVIRKDHTVIHWNKALEELSGIKAENVIGTSNHWMAFYRHNRPCLADLLVDGLVDEIPKLYPGKYVKSELIEDAYEATDFFPELCDEGRWLHFTAAAMKDSKGAMVGAIETLEDVTEKKQMEEALRENEERLRAILEGSPTPTFVIDRNHRVIVWNKAMAELTGVQSANVINTCDHPKAFYRETHPTVADLLVDGTVDLTSKIRRWYGREYQPSKLLDEAYESTGPLTFPDKQPSWTHFTSAAIRDGKGELIGAMETMTDVSPLKHAEDKLKENVTKLRKVMNGIIWSIGEIVETRDPYTAGHQHQVTQLATAIAKQMNLPPETREAIRVSALLHDLGKIYIPAEILSKPGHISSIEREFIRTHPQVGYEILKSIEFPWPIAEIVLQHHERMDGSGYPRGLRNGDILLEARIVGLADVVESMGSHRPYRPTLGIERALAEICKNRGILYDPSVVDACVVLFKDKNFQFEEAKGSGVKWHSNA
jgi:PAS domain S-box-containing protein/putative nucleotidyltransferase with HDIG domain